MSGNGSSIGYTKTKEKIIGISIGIGKIFKLNFWCATIINTRLPPVGYANDWMVVLLQLASVLKHYGLNKHS
jgi:hypothetical protein